MSAEAAGGKRSFTITRFTTGTQQNNILSVDVEISGNAIKFRASGTTKHIF